MMQARTMNKEQFRAWNERMASLHDPDQYHESENTLVRWIERRRVQKILNFLEVHDYHRVLDVGVGAGNILENVRALERVGIDLSPSLLRKARARLGKDVALIEGDVEELTRYVTPTSFDRVYCSEVLEHLQNPSRAISEMANVVKPDGIVVVSVPNEVLILILKMFLKWTGLSSFIGFDLERCRGDEWHLHAFSRALLKTICRQHFIIERISAVPFTILPLRYVAKLRPRFSYE